MSEQKVIAYPDFGPVTFKKNSKAKHISIRIKPGPLVYVTLPYRATVKDGQRVLVNKKSWVIKKMYELQETETVFKTGKEISFKYHQLKVESANVSAVKVQSKDKTVTVLYPESLSVEAPEIQDGVKDVIREIWKAEAKIYLPQRITWLAHTYGFIFQNVTIRDARTRWGSCTGLKNISLSLYIMRLPHHLIDYVLLHELCHTVVPNHGKDFYELMNKVTKGKTTEYQKEMRAFKPWL